jgi:hypothetical protein
MDFGDVVKYLVLLLHNRKIDLGFHQRADWHNALYWLAQPPLFSKAPETFHPPKFFEWNGPYPISSEIAETISGFCSSRCVTWESPGLTKYHLDECVAKIWQKGYDGLSEEERYFLENVALGRLLEDLVT